MSMRDLMRNLLPTALDSQAGLYAGQRINAKV